MNTDPDATHDYTERIKCPHCNYEHEDSYEFGEVGDEAGEANCDECGEPMIWVRHISIEYSTRKVKDDKRTT